MTIIVALDGVPSDCYADAPYSGQLGATGGTGPYTYEITSTGTYGVLPPGLSMDASGAITGQITSAALGHYWDVAFKATDSLAASGGMPASSPTWRFRPQAFTPLP